MEFLRHRALVLRGLWTLPNDVQLVAQAKTLCGDCIKWRLSRTGTTFNASSQSSAPSYKSSRILAEASCVLLLFAQELEAMFPDLFHNVDRKLQILALAELEVSEALHAFATLLFYEQQVTWGRVVALFMVAANLAEVCVAHGCPALIHTIVDCIGVIFLKTVLPWVKAQGGWSDMVRTLDCRKRPIGLCWLLGSLATILGLIVLPHCAEKMY
uniref:Bcl-2 Bcl-2 homology region 1-3 domain-containing protein n=1 Tax=Eptatretus burgeri TaxID=7764 RepID=A0A8C4QU09_EPTBU